MADDSQPCFAALLISVFSFKTQEEIQEFCRCNGIPYMVILKDGDTGAKVQLLILKDSKKHDPVMKSIKIGV